MPVANALQDMLSFLPKRGVTGRKSLLNPSKIVPKILTAQQQQQRYRKWEQKKAIVKEQVHSKWLVNQAVVLTDHLNSFITSLS